MNLKASSKTLLIADTGPLLALARIAQLPLLKQLFGEVNVTHAVFSECQAKPERADAVAVQAALDGGVFTLIANPVVTAKFSQLDLGEQTALQTALTLKASVLMDEAKGRKVAKANHIHVIGTIGILLLAKKRGLVAAVAPLLAALDASGYRLSPALIQQAKELANE